MRNVIGFVLAAGLLCAGLFLLWIEWTGPYHWNRMLIVGLFLTLIGGGWLWSDYIGPRFGRGGKF